MSKLLLLFAAILFSGAVHGQFSGPYNIDSEGKPYGVTTADFNTDGNIDVLLVDGNNNAWWMPNNGAGKFEQSVTVPVTFAPITLTTGEFDGNAGADIVLGEREKLHLYTNTGGSGNFANAVEVFSSTPFSSSPYEREITKIKAADLNGDGLDDLLVSLSDSSSVYWLENAGTGTFNTAKPVRFLNMSPPSYEFLPVDLDHDNDLDLFFLYYHELTILKNDGSGVMTTTYLDLDFLGWGQWGFLQDYGDYDHDGDPDLLVMGFNGNNIYWLLNDGTGNFPTHLEIQPGIPAVEAIRAGDFDGDSDLDLGVLHGNQFSWLLNNGTPNWTISAESNISGKTLGRAERAVVLKPGSKNALLVYNNAYYEGVLETFSLAPNEDQLILPRFLINSALTLNDYDNDGDNDLIMAGEQQFGQIGLYERTAPGKFVFKRFLYKDAAANNPWALATANLDADNDVDLVYQQTQGPFTQKLVNNGGFLFGAPALINIPLNSAPFPFDGSLHLEDVDSDGDADLLTGGVPTLGRNNGSGNFTTFETLINISDTLSLVFEPTDFDNDADPDLALRDGDKILLLRNDGTGHYALMQTLTGNGRPGYPKFADFDGDGLTDMEVDFLDINAKSEIVWYKNLGNGFSAVGQTIHPGSQTYFLHSNVTDLDLDGDIDIVIIRSANNQYFATFFYNNGDGTFAPGQDLLQFDELPFRILFDDVDGDGDPDILFRALFSTFWYKNRAGEPFISGKCFWDKNENYILDAGDEPLNQMQVTLSPSASYTFTDAQGNYRFYADPGNYELSYRQDSCWELTTGIDVYNITFTGLAAESRNFGFRQTGTSSNFSLFLAPSLPRCDMTVPFTLTLTNASCSPASGRMAFLPDPLLAAFAGAVPYPDAFSGDTLFWQVPATAAGGQHQVVIQLKIADASHVGEILKVEAAAWIDDPGAGAQVLNKHIAESAEIRCSFDPNDKTVNLEKVQEGYDPFANMLQYLIRFQNTGNDTAFAVRVRDTLDARFDLSTFRPIAASHPYYVVVDAAARALEFRFDPVQLPPVGVDEPGSHGFVAYSIALEPNLPISTVVPNTGFIYFDSNPAIVTNTITTEIVAMLGTGQPATLDQSLQLSPNPASGQVTLRWTEPLAANASLKMLDARGNLIRMQTIAAGTDHMFLDISDNPPGLYFIDIRQYDGQRQAGKVLKM